MRTMTQLPCSFRPLSPSVRLSHAVGESRRGDRPHCDLWDAVTAGKLTLPIDRRFPLDQAVEAHAHMRENKHFGKIVLTM
jgi:NADPH:quinone reductase-like Zn-dependent oxidoreductase